MGSWPVQDAKARFSELLDTALRSGPQVVTRRSVEAAVLVPRMCSGLLCIGTGPGTPSTSGRN